MSLAVITGASRGLGAALARALAARGWDLVVDARSPVPLAAAHAGLRALGSGAGIVSVPGDVADASHRAELARAAGARPVAALVLNAGTLGPSPRPRVLDLSPADFDEILRVNVTAQLALVQTLRNRLPAGAAILAITSDAGVEPYAGWGGYGASKAAFEHLAAILAVEEPRWRVYRVDPGDMRTRMHQDAFPGEDISDRPGPEQSVPGLLALIDTDLPSGRYRARDLAALGREGAAC